MLLMWSRVPVSATAWLTPATKLRQNIQQDRTVLVLKGWCGPHHRVTIIQYKNSDWFQLPLADSEPEYGICGHFFVLPTGQTQKAPPPLSSLLKKWNASRLIASFDEFAPYEAHCKKQKQEEACRRVNSHCLMGASEAGSLFFPFYLRGRRQAEMVRLSQPSPLSEEKMSTSLDKGCQNPPTSYSLAYEARIICLLQKLWPGTWSPSGERHKKESWLPRF